MYINDGKLNFQNILLSEYIDKSSLISYTNKSLYSPSTKFLGSVQKNVGSHSGSFQTVIPFLP